MAEHEFIQHLKDDHDEQKDIAEKLINATEPSERERLRQGLYDALYPHMVGEEASVFPRLLEADDEEIKDTAQEGLQEHHMGKIALRELMGLSLDSDVFKAKAQVLDEMNRHHIDEEKDEVFGHLQELCSDQELSELFEKYEAAEEEAEG